MKLVFLLAACTNSLVDNFPYEEMLMANNLIELGIWKLILNQLIVRNCVEFCNVFLESFFVKVTLGSDSLKFSFWTENVKIVMTINAYAVLNFNP